MKAIRFLLILAILGALGYAAYRILLPEVITNAINSEEIPSYIPESTREELQEVRKTIDDQVKKLPEKMEEMDLSYEDLMLVVEEMNEKDILATYESLRKSPPSTTDEAYDVIVNNLQLESVDMERFRTYFNESVTVDKINDVVIKAEKSKLFSQMSLPVLKSTIKQLLMQREDEIKSRLEESNK
ncbi:hypothetical protein AB9P05_15300 [Roseivirga sp. BDSF3-8]|uniref:hypothetical protein n=1 Tax=Roseivirga sp. BDSF3-8 TaxID=3241598 RepID=UPI003531C933